MPIGTLKKKTILTLKASLLKHRISAPKYPVRGLFMNFFFLIFLTFFCGLFSVVFNNKFFLSLLIRLEIILINLMAFVFYLNIIQSDVRTLIFAPYILTFSAIEASIGISLMTLLSRNSNTNKLKLLKVLKR